MKIKLTHIIGLGLLLITFFGFQNTTHADTFTYKPLTTLPGFFDQGKPVQTPEDLVSGAYTLAIGTASILAVLMIVWGGIKYIVSDTPFEKGDGKKDIQNAFYGMIILLAAYIILRTINIDLVKRTVIFETPDNNNFGKLVSEQQAAEKSYNQALMKAKASRELENATKKELEKLIKDIDGQEKNLSMLKTGELFDKCLSSLKNAAGIGEIAYAIDGKTATIEEILINKENKDLLAQPGLDNECTDLFTKIKEQASTLSIAREQKEKIESFAIEVRIDAEINVLKSNIINITTYKGGGVGSQQSGFDGLEITNRALLFIDTAEKNISKEIEKAKQNNYPEEKIKDLTNNLNFLKVFKRDTEDIKEQISLLQDKTLSNVNKSDFQKAATQLKIINERSRGITTDYAEIKKSLISATLDASEKDNSGYSLRQRYCTLDYLQQTIICQKI